MQLGAVSAVAVFCVNEVVDTRSLDYVLSGLGTLAQVSAVLCYCHFTGCFSLTRSRVREEEFSFAHGF